MIFSSKNHAFAKYRLPSNLYTDIFELFLRPKRSMSLYVPSLYNHTSVTFGLIDRYIKSISERETPTNTQISILGENRSVVKKVIYQIIASCFSIFQALFNGVKRIILITASIIIAARLATGR